MDPTTGCSVSFFDLGDVKAKNPDSIAYIALYALGYDDQGKERRTQVDSQPWTLAAWQALGLLPEGATTLDAQIAAATAYVNRTVAANTEGGTRRFEVHIMGPNGTSRLMTRKVSCTRLGTDGMEESGGLSSDPPAAATLEVSDALAALPGTRALLAGQSVNIELTRKTAEAGISLMDMMQRTWQRENDRLNRNLDAAAVQLKLRDDEISRLHVTVRDLTEAILSADGATGGTPGVPTELLKETAGEVTSTLKQIFLHYIGAPTEIAPLLEAVKIVPEALRSKLLNPETLAALANPAHLSTITQVLDGFIAAAKEAPVG